METAPVPSLEARQPGYGGRVTACEVHLLALGKGVWGVGGTQTIYFPMDFGHVVSFSGM